MQRGVALAAAAAATVVGVAALLVAWAFGCGSSDAIPNCESGEVVLWWGLPAISFTLACCSVWAAHRLGRSPSGLRLFLVIWTAAVIGCTTWWLALVLPG